jgi:hypothetical protein
MTPYDNSPESPENLENPEGAVARSKPITAKVKTPILRKDKLLPAFWTITTISSLIINVILIAVLLSLGNYIFAIKTLIRDQLVTGLYGNFMLMDEARIKTTIPVSAEVPAKFNLPLETDTIVTLTQDTYIKGARVNLYTGGLAISNAPADITLPANTELPVHLSLVVPVDQKIPVNLNVEVDIPLNKTDLHAPFVGLQQVVDPYYSLLWDLPSSWEEAICGRKPGAFCKFIIP